MTEQEVREHVGGLAGDYKCYNPLISHEESLILHNMINKPEPHWIPVTERPPEIGESVMICDAYGDICIGHRTNGGYYFPDFCGDKIKDVRAWCELPEPFKGVTE